jgi:hypothetical protein
MPRPRGSGLCKVRGGAQQVFHHMDSKMLWGPVAAVRRDGMWLWEHERVMVFRLWSELISRSARTLTGGCDRCTSLAKAMHGRARCTL